MRILEFFQSSNGRFSSMRLGMLVWVIGPFIPWVWLCFVNKRWEPIDENIWKVIGAAGATKVASDVWSNKKSSATK